MTMKTGTNHDIWTDRHHFLENAQAVLGDKLGDAIALRHEIHADPRVSGNERDTTLIMQRALGADDGAWIEQGMVARFGAADGPAIAIRAELDALPVTEDSTVPWTAKGNVAHLCGHDVHMAALTAVIGTIIELGTPVPVLAVLQPREETLPCGAADFIASDVLLQHEIRYFIGVHLQPSLPQGSFSAAPGPVNAAADEFSVVMEGRAAHGAYPQLARDPIVAIAALIGSLQHLVSRRADPMSPAVLTVGNVNGGTSFNAIPAEASIRGTIRTFDEGFRASIHNLVKQTADGIASAYGCKARVEIGLGEPVMNNDSMLSGLITGALIHEGFTEGDPLRSCGADDFSYYGTRFPSLMIFAGTGTGDQTAPGLHHPAFVPPDSAVGEVSRIMLTAYAAAAERILGEPS